MKKQASSKGKMKKSHVPWIQQRSTIVLLLTLMVLVVYGQTVFFGFTWFDDDAILLRNHQYISDLSNLPEAVVRDAEFTEKNIELYRPLQNITFMLDASVGGFEGGMFHFTNMIIHLGTVLLLFFLLQKMLFSVFLAGLGAALLAIHPVFAFTVCWLPARGDLLLAFWSLLAFRFFLNYLEHRENRWLWWNLLAFTLALFSKETALMLVPMCVIWYLGSKPKPFFQSWQLIPVVGYIAVLILYLYLRSMAIYDVKAGAMGLLPFLSNLPVLPETLLKFFVPYPLPALPFYTLEATLGGLVVIALLAIVIVRYKLYSPLFFFGVLWFLIFNLPAMFYRPDWSDYIYDYIIHRSYLPLVGIIVALLALLGRWGDVLMTRQYLRGLAVVVLVFMLISIGFSRVFRDPLPFWRYAVKTNPASAFTHKYLGGALFLEEQLDQAIESYNRSLELKPDFEEVRLNRGIALAANGAHAEAVKDFSFYLDSNPLDTMILRYRVLSLMELADYQSALPDLILLRSEGDRSVRMHYSLGVCYLLTGQYPEAKTVMDELLTKHPSNVGFLRIGGLADLAAGYPEQAIDRYLKVLTMDPSYNTLSNLGYAYWESGRYQDALGHFRRAEALNPESFAIHIGKMLSFYAMGQLSDMKQSLDVAITIDPVFEIGESALDTLKKQGYIFTPAQTKAIRSIMKW
jgi:protein O-mannosyl-transferase